MESKSTANARDVDGNNQQDGSRSCSGRRSARTNRAAIKRIFSIGGIVLSALVLLAGLTVWNRHFRTPPVDLLPLPENLVSLQSPIGQELLAGSAFLADYEKLKSNFVSQSRPTFCGVASSVIALNALRNASTPLDQSTFFTDAARGVKDPFRVSLSGMSLAQLGDLLRAHGAEAEVIYASDTDVGTFRTMAQRNLMTSGDFVLVNYQRAELGQVEAGHISPLAAYHAGTDRFLILDVAAYKYPPVWVSTETLWNAMSASVGSLPLTRGFIVVRERSSGLPDAASVGPDSAQLLLQPQLRTRNRSLAGSKAGGTQPKIPLPCASAVERIA